jgi:CopZ-like zinc binding protein
MNCCTTDDTVGAIHSEANEAACSTDEPHETNLCGSCKGKGRPVSRKTVLLMLKPELLERAMHGSYSFCSERECSIVYFEDKGGEHFTVDDLRIRVGVKVKNDPIPLCYCFGFDENHIRDEIERTGNTSIPDKVSGLIREGLCACEVRNPAGVCCLGEVNKAMQRVKLELGATKNG